MSKINQICSRCVMDTTANDIVFDDSNVCNYCSEFFSTHGKLLKSNENKIESNLKNLLEKVRKQSKGKKYERS